MKKTKLVFAIAIAKSARRIIWTCESKKLQQVNMYPIPLKKGPQYAIPHAPIQHSPLMRNAFGMLVLDVQNAQDLQPFNAKAQPAKL
jgi:hypothetical protein